MKKLSVLILTSLIVAAGFAQKENGKVFIEHPVLGKVNQLWVAFEKGDQVSYAALLADSVRIFRNGNMFKQTREEVAKGLDWWAKEFENLKVLADTPAYADAIEYEQGGLWVQDWLRITGTSTKTGINLDLQMHNLYRFNKEGKISGIHHYFNNDIFEEIRNSARTLENGTVYINHPYILAVRKCVNAFCNEDLDGMLQYFSDKATFSNLMMNWGDKSMMLKEQSEHWKAIFAENSNISMTQFGYPDCIYYSKNDDYVVYSWWVYRSVNKDGQKVEMPIMLSDTFDKDGKIINSMYYYSSNHLK